MTEPENILSHSKEVAEGENKRESYPIKTFKTIEPFVGNVYKKYGSDGLHSLEKIADANNLSVNSIKQTVSTCTQYGCFKKSHGKGYQITDVFTKIFHPENDEQKKSLIIDCLKNVPFYIDLFADYNEKVVPSIEGLQNRFIREYKMKPHLAKNAAEIYTQNLRDFELLNNRNVLIVSTNIGKIESTSSMATKETADATLSNGNGSGNSNGNEMDKASITIPIRLKGNRMASLTFPFDFNDEDLVKLFKVTKAYIQAYGENLDLSNI